MAGTTRSPPSTTSSSSDLPRPAKTGCTNLDLWVNDIDSETARPEALGARRMQDEPFAEHGLRGYQLADPKGNEFCVANRM